MHLSITKCMCMCMCVGVGVICSINFSFYNKHGDQIINLQNCLYSSYIEANNNRGKAMFGHMSWVRIFD